MLDHSYNKVQARVDFDKARTKASFNKMFKRLFRKDNKLYQFDEVKYLLSPQGMAYRGVKTIPIDRIVGSEGRYQDFDGDFLPLSDNTRSRWENIDIAKKIDIILPPILVYKIQDFYFVRDGNHRVSVARELEQEFIDAEVVELFTKVKINEINDKELLIAESYHYFLEKTKFDEIIPHVTLEFSNPWGYYRLIEHINTYKYIKETSEKREIKWDEALKKWYNNLYLTVVMYIRKKKMMRNFPGRTEGDLYIWVMDHWHYLKEKCSGIVLEDAIEDYHEKYGKKSFIKKILELIKKPGL